MVAGSLAPFINSHGIEYIKYTSPRHLWYATRANHLSFLFRLASSSTPDEDVPPTLHPCTTCDITFHSPAELTTHCQSDLHKKKASSDDGHDWKHRPPPRGLTGEEYTKCPR